MIQIVKENGEVVFCDRLLGVAFKDGGLVYHVTEGPLDLIDVLYTKKVMEDHEMNILSSELKRRADSGVPNLTVVTKAPPKHDA